MSDQNTILPDILTDEIKIFILSAVLIPVRYKSKGTTKRMRIDVAVTWILALAISATVYLSYELTLPEPFVRRH